MGSQLSRVRSIVSDVFGSEAELSEHLGSGTRYYNVRCDVMKYNKILMEKINPQLWKYFGFGSTSLSIEINKEINNYFENVVHNYVSVHNLGPIEIQVFIRLIHDYTFNFHYRLCNNKLVFFLYANDLECISKSFKNRLHHIISDMIEFRIIPEEILEVTIPFNVIEHTISLLKSFYIGLPICEIRSKYTDRKTSILVYPFLNEQSWESHPFIKEHMLTVKTSLSSYLHDDLINMVTQFN